MHKETINTNNKFILPTNGDAGSDEARKQIVENLQNITSEQARAVGEELDQKMKEREQEAFQSLLDYRQVRKEKIYNISDDFRDYMDDILKKLDQIPVKVEIEKDGSRLIEFILNEREYKILDPKLKTHSDEKYLGEEEYISITKRDEGVKVGGMKGDDVSKWKNEKLRKYVQQKQQEGLHIPSENEMKKLWGELGKQVGLPNILDQMAMLMYLTGMDGCYWLSMRDSDTRFVMDCNVKFLDVGYSYDDDSSGSLCMISCEGDDTGKIDDTKDTVNVKFSTIGTIAGMPVEFDESKRIVKFDGDTFDLNSYQGRLSFIGRVSQYDNLFSESVKKIMFTLNI